MSRKQVLVVVDDPVEPAELSKLLRAEVGPDAAVRVVGSPSLSRLEWLTNDEDAARREAVAVAQRAAEQTGENVRAEQGPGDSDPAQAAEDALRFFSADEIVVVSTHAEPVPAPLRALGVPVRTVALPSNDDEGGT